MCNISAIFNNTRRHHMLFAIHFYMHTRDNLRRNQNAPLSIKILDFPWERGGRGAASDYGRDQWFVVWAGCITY